MKIKGSLNLLAMAQLQGGSFAPGQPLSEFSLSPLSTCAMLQKVVDDCKQKSSSLDVKAAYQAMPLVMLSD